MLNHNIELDTKIFQRGLKICKYLLKYYSAKELNLSHYTKANPILPALKFKSLEPVKMLLSHGLNPNVKIEGMCPIIHAIIHNNYPVVRLLFDYSVDLDTQITQCTFQIFLSPTIPSLSRPVGSNVKEFVSILYAHYKNFNQVPNEFYKILDLFGIEYKIGSEYECVICLEQSKTNVFTLDCTHKFYFDCVTIIVKPTNTICCPLCRIINPVEPIKITIEMVCTGGSRFIIKISPWRTMFNIYQILCSRYKNAVEKFVVMLGNKILDKKSPKK